MTEFEIPMSRPDITELEINEVLGVLRSPWLSLGPKIDEFEASFRSFVGSAHAVAVANGTCGLHLALRAVGVGEGTDVITTPFSFVATANVVLMERATPVFVDIDPQTMNLTPGLVEEAIEQRYMWRDGQLRRREGGAPLSAILPVSVFGHPVDMDGFRSLADRYGLKIVLDACEGLGSQYWSPARGAWVSEATLADVAVYAFYPNKQITTGEGGMVVTESESVARYCRMARNQGRRLDSPWLEHEILGFNYRMDEMSAALGVAQLRRVDELLQRRVTIAAWYDQEFQAMAELARPEASPWARVVWFLYVVRLRPGIDRDGVIRELHRRKIDARPYFPPIHLQPQWRTMGYRPGDFPVTESIATRTLALPFYNKLTREQVSTVAQAVKEAIHTHVG